MAVLIAAGSSTYLPPLLEKFTSWFQTTPVGEAFTPNCRTGLGVTADNAAFSKGARVIVAEDLNGRRIADQRLRVGEEVLVVFEGPSNAVKGGRDARQFVYFATDVDDRRVSSKLGTTVTCGRFEHISSIVEEDTQRRETPTPSRTITPTPGSTPTPPATPAPDRIANLEAQLREITAKATRTAEDGKLAETERAVGAANARATIIAEAQATAVIREAEKRGRESYIATVTAAVSPTAGAAGTRAGGGSEIPSIPSIPWIPLAGGLGILALIGAEFKFQRVRRTTKNIIRLPDRAFKRFILKQAGTQLWP